MAKSTITLCSDFSVTFLLVLNTTTTTNNNNNNKIATGILGSSLLETELETFISGFGFFILKKLYVFSFLKEREISHPLIQFTNAHSSWQGLAKPKPESATTIG